MKRYLLFWVVMAVGAISLSSCRPEADASSREAADRSATARKSQQPTSPSPAVDTNWAIHTAYSDSPHVLHGGAGSIDELIDKAVTAMARRDTATLNDLLVGHQEWEEYLYPEFGIYYPAARDPRPEVRDFLWTNHSLSSDKALRRSLDRYSRERLTFDSVHFEDTAQVFHTYTIHQGTVAKAHDREHKEHELRCFGSIVEMNGVYKFLSFRDRD
jgi:hypothetical protein